MQLVTDNRTEKEFTPSMSDSTQAIGKVLDGIRVLELSHFAYVPSAGAILSDWGADVVKVENPTHGDPARGITIGGIPPGAGGFTFMWELTNRGKRSVGINVASENGYRLLLRLVESADVFLTSFLPNVRQKLKLTETDIRAVNPTIIYATGSGQGSRGDEALAGGFDQTSFWFRSGIASALNQDGSLSHPPELPGPGFGDVASGMALAGGIAAALVHRERTGEGGVVEGSLLATGMWMMQPSIVATEMTGRSEFRWLSRTETTNPLVNSYRTSDGRYIGLCVMHADKHWAELCEAIGRPELVDDPRFADQVQRAENSAECVKILDDTFATRSLAEWQPILSSQGAQWSVIQQVSELQDDPQVRANGYLRPVDYGAGRSLSLVPAPVQHNRTVPDLQPAPELGASTEEILLDLGVEWDEIARLKGEDVIT